MSITVSSIDLGEIEGGLGVSIEGMVGRIKDRLAEIVPDPGVYDIDASIEFEEESGIYVATGVARHKTRDGFRTHSVKFLADGSTISDLEKNALQKAREFFETEEVSIKLGVVSNLIDGIFRTTVTAKRN